MAKGTDIDTEYEIGRISLIAAVGRNRELGKDGKLLWHIPEDMRRFKKLTTGHPIIMGRKTWESLSQQYRPLPGRTNIVVTRQIKYEAPGATIVNSLEAACVIAARVSGANEIFVIGGGELYIAALAFADRLYLTLVDATAEADTYFPPYEQDFQITSDEVGAGEPVCRFLVLEQKEKHAT
ncbi:MAG TPA: dihydrofolate reductase [Candidatus Paceibacterota bacterium]|nr:dihydrofolate reductase [Candidatus Paceibacterota bacterium]